MPMARARAMAMASSLVLRVGKGMACDEAIDGPLMPPCAACDGRRAPAPPQGVR